MAVRTARVGSPCARLLSRMHSHQHPCRQRSKNPCLERSSWLLPWCRLPRRLPRCRSHRTRPPLPVSLPHALCPSWALAQNFLSQGANQLVSWKLFQARSPPWGVWRTGGSTDTWKTLLKFYSVNCLVFHVGQRSRSRCIRTIIRENGGIGIEVATLS